MLLTIRSGAVCFSTIPLQPSFMACTNSFLSSEAVSTMTRVRLLVCCSACSADSPSRLGMRRSSSSTSGSSSWTLSKHLAAVAGFADDLEIVFQSKEFLEAVPDNGMVVGDENSNHALPWFRGTRLRFIPFQCRKGIVHI